jgi:hypothetical protein
MKRVLLLIVLCFYSMTHAQENLFTYDYRNVPQEEMDVFMANEAEYWSKIHANLLKKGKITGWALCTRVGGLASEPNVYFFIGTGSYENLDNGFDGWAEAEKEVRSTMDTEKLKLIDERLKQDKFRVGNVLLSRSSSAGSSGDEWNYLVHNYTNSTDVGAFLDLQEKYFKPFFEKNIKEKNTKQVYWNTASVLSPRGHGYNWNCYTVDFFKNYSDIFNAWNKEVIWPEEGMTEAGKLMKDQSFYKSVVWRKAMWLDSDGNLKTFWD